MNRNAILAIAVFVSGAVVLIFELVGVRIMAPHLGTTIFVWTAIIGVILGSLSLGYYFGGYWADKKPRFSVLSLILFLAAISVVITIFVKEPLLTLLQDNITSIRTASVLASLALFLPASFFLGMVSPYAVKLKLADLNTSGRTVGNLYAISTVGSIIGTFLAGFYLIPSFGISSILWMLAAILVVLSIIVSLNKYIGIKLAVLIMMIVSLLFFGDIQAQDFFVDVDTAYSRLRVTDREDLFGERSIRDLYINDAVNSSMYINDPAELVHDYTKYYHLVRHFVPNFEKALMIGGGAYSFPKNYLASYPSAKIDIVEIDPKVTEIAQNYFGLEDNERLEIFHEDARTYLNKVETKYDAIFADTFRTHFELPYQLTTTEAIQKKYDALNENGVVIVNIVSTIEGENGRFLRAEYATYKEVFPYVYLFPATSPTDGKKLQNIMLVAVKSQSLPSLESADPQLNEYLESQWKDEIDRDVPVLTDNFAPVEYLMRSTI